MCHGSISPSVVVPVGQCLVELAAYSHTFETKSLQLKFSCKFPASLDTQSQPQMLASRWLATDVQELTDNQAGIALLARTGLAITSLVA